MASPSKIPKVHNAEAEAIRERFQLIAYKCQDPRVNPCETANQIITLGQEVMTMMTKWTNQNKALNQNVTGLRQQLKEKEKLLKEALAQADVYAAARDFCNDDVQDASTQTDPTDPMPSSTTEDDNTSFPVHHDEDL